MAGDTVPMGLMFDACHRVLVRQMRPLGYTDLTELALAELGLSRQDVHWGRQIEDVREKMLLAGRHDSFYVGAPHCLAGLRWWFAGRQLRLLHPTPGVLIPGNAAWSAEGAFEALVRDPYLKIKTGAPRDRIARVRAWGYVLEKHVSGWFRQNWPQFYLPPENAGRWRAGSDHDFRLRVEDRTLKVDVSGPRQGGGFGNPGNGKRRTDLHLICQMMGEDVLWQAVVAGRDYGRTISPDFGGIWPERLVVWLNCKQAGLDYAVVSQAALQTQRVCGTVG